MQIFAPSWHPPQGGACLRPGGLGWLGSAQKNASHPTLGQLLRDSEEVWYTRLVHGVLLWRQASLRLQGSMVLDCHQGLSTPLEKKVVMKQKMKTHTAMAKRVKVTGSGKFMRRKVAASHLRRNKSPQAVRSMDKEFHLATSDTRRMKRLLPYAF